MASGLKTLTLWTSFRKSKEKTPAPKLATPTSFLCSNLRSSSNLTSFLTLNLQGCEQRTHSSLLPMVIEVIYSLPPLGASSLSRFSLEVRRGDSPVNCISSRLFMLVVITLACFPSWPTSPDQGVSMST